MRRVEASADRVQGEAIRDRSDVRLRDLFRGCLLGGAVGDALGAPVEFMSRASILERFDGPIRDYSPAYGKVGAITDDTQMTLFTAEGVMRSFVRANTKGICHPPSVIANAYMRWLHTQGIRHESHAHCLDGWLISNRQLHARRAPGNTCISALRALKSPGEPAQNDSKGCGGVMRVAPIGMHAARRGNGRLKDGELRDVFKLAADSAAITHGHLTGQLSAGHFAVVIAQLLTGETLLQAIERGLHFVQGCEGHQETTIAIQAACRLAATRPNDPFALKHLGEGWIAEEALAISLYSALSASTFEDGVVLAVNHDGDSDSTGSMTGNLLGAMKGTLGIPERWLGDLERRDVIEGVADDMASITRWDIDNDDAPEESNYLWRRYPGA